MISLTDEAKRVLNGNPVLLTVTLKEFAGSVKILATNAIGESFPGLPFYDVKSIAEQCVSEAVSNAIVEAFKKIEHYKDLGVFGV
jgi:hypothetical protein